MGVIAALDISLFVRVGDFPKTLRFRMHFNCICWLSKPKISVRSELKSSRSLMGCFQLSFNSLLAFGIIQSCWLRWLRARHPSCLRRTSYSSLLRHLRLVREAIDRLQLQKCYRLLIKFTVILSLKLQILIEYLRFSKGGWLASQFTRPQHHFPAIFWRTLPDSKSQSK